MHLHGALEPEVIVAAVRLTLCMVDRLACEPAPIARTG
jgi:hypothetical protein